MREDRTVVDILERVRESRRRKRCPDCEAVASIRGVRGEYWWECPNCDAIGIGYNTRSAALEGLQNRRS
ncbi:hypothetical protein [Natrialbaceae archaeon AArc-T1-2]|uniref:hypothetical protein n=1 Tax=Natrialbaceae archaeon AArc-T1-2 TaxID=3053904 RepID=UPI00255AE9F3|nr:hypothetical protein [Natrialbaceae archaeon AArc-T1-2]WIV67592.1 hypothetical protein QQ977_02345 [Natrialbaceae archaeon AArc-T1-2]